MTRRPEPQRSVKHDWLDGVLGDRGELDGYAVAVATALWSHMNRQGACYPSVRTIAAEAKVSKSTVEDRIKVLEAGGYLDVRRRPRGANLYTCVLPGGTTVLPDGTDGRGRRVGAPSVLPDGASVPYPQGSVPPGNASVLSGDVSVLPGGTEHVNPWNTGEHANPSALSGVRPGGASALGADQPGDYDEAASLLGDISRYIDDYDKELDNALNEIDPEMIIDPPDDVIAAYALETRLKQLNCHERDREGGHIPREDITARQVEELSSIELSLRVWVIDPNAPDNPDGAPAPGWLIRTTQRRAKYLAGLRESLL